MRSADGRVHLVARGGDGVGIGEVDLDRKALATVSLQLGDDLPSHILVPAVHRNRAEIREIFRRAMGQAGRPAPAGVTVSGRSACSAPIWANSGARSMWTRREVTLPSALRSSRDTHGTGTSTPPLVV